MKPILILIAFFAIQPIAYSQIQVSKKEGGSVVTKLAFGVKVNDGSSLMRQYIILNDLNCPAQLVDVGIETAFAGQSYSFKPVGSLTAKEPLSAFEVNYILYDVFGNHIKTLTNIEINDISSSVELAKTASWYGTENQISEYLICVAYVANVRKKDNSLWHYNYKSIKDQLDKLTIAFDENYIPKKDTDKQ